MARGHPAAAADDTDRARDARALLWALTAALALGAIALVAREATRAAGRRRAARVTRARGRARRRAGLGQSRRGRAAPRGRRARPPARGARAAATPTARRRSPGRSRSRRPSGCSRWPTPSSARRPREAPPLPLADAGTLGSVARRTLVVRARARGAGRGGRGRRRRCSAPTRSSSAPAFVPAGLVGDRRPRPVREHLLGHVRADREHARRAGGGRRPLRARRLLGRRLRGAAAGHARGGAPPVRALLHAAATGRAGLPAGAPAKPVAGRLLGRHADLDRASSSPAT